MKESLTPARLGQMLREFRKSKSLTIRDAAALAGVGERFLSELERGKGSAQLGLTLKVVERFGLTLTLNTRDGTALEDADG